MNDKLPLSTSTVLYKYIEYIHSVNNKYLISMYIVLHLYYIKYKK